MVGPEALCFYKLSGDADLDEVQTKLLSKKDIRHKMSS